MTATKPRRVRGFLGAVVLFRSKLLGWDAALALIAAIAALYFPSADADLMSLAGSFAPDGNRLGRVTRWRRGCSVGRGGCVLRRGVPRPD